MRMQHLRSPALGKDNKVVWSSVPEGRQRPERGRQPHHIAPFLLLHVHAVPVNRHGTVEHRLPNAQVLQARERGQPGLEVLGLWSQ